MGSDASLALTGRRAIPRRFLDQALAFEFADLRAALQDLLA
jgi:NAD dependent epimerase/dehydratase family enzyme